MDLTLKSPCRLCLKCDSAKVNVFTDYPNIPHIVYELFSFWIKPSDKAPKEICLECITTTKSFHTFTLTVKESQRILNNSHINTRHNDNIKIESDNKSEIKVKEELLNDIHCALNLNGVQSSKGALDSTPFKYEIPIFNKKKKSHSCKRHEYKDNTSSQSSKELIINQHSTEESNDSEQKEVTQEQNIEDVVSIPKEIFRHGILVIPKESLDGLICSFYNIVCDFCDDKPKFQKYLDLFDHCKKQHGEEGFLQCCDCKLIERRTIVAHMACHLQPDAFQCKVCKTNFSSPKLLFAHTRDVHTPRSLMQHQCDLCNKRYRTIGLLRMHKVSSHPPHSKAPCSECSKVFYSETALKRHMSSIHSGRQCLCPVCGKTLQNKANLNIHMKVHDASGSNAVQCQECGVIAKSKESLRMHLRLQHSGRELNCDQCEYCAKNSTALKHHMFTKHSDDKPFVCQVCHKSFKRKANLKDHSVQHTGEHKYSCTFCLRTFASSGNCYSHRKRMHPDQYKTLQTFTRNGSKMPEDI